MCDYVYSVTEWEVADFEIMSSAVQNRVSCFGCGVLFDVLFVRHSVVLVVFVENWVNAFGGFVFAWFRIRLLLFINRSDMIYALDVCVYIYI